MSLPVHQKKTVSERIFLSPYALVVIALISCSMLIYEILLTRIIALRLYFHFAFLVISNCLLGIGASGTMIAIFQESWKRRSRLLVTLFSGLYLVSLVFTYVFLCKFYIPDDLSLWRSADLYRFFVYNTVAAVPFFFAGTVVGMILTFHAERIATVYFVDLIGAGIGCFLCPFLLSGFGAGGCIVVVFLLALTAGVIAFPAGRKKAVVAGGIGLGIVGLWLLPTFDQKFPVPGKTLLDFTDETQLSVGKNIELSEWSAIGRIDMASVDETNRLIRGLGNRVAGTPPIPEQKIVLQDGAAGTFFTNFSEHPEALRLLERSMYSIPMQLKDRPRVLIIGAGGGHDMWAAKIHGASFIKGIELHQSIVDIHSELLPEYSKLLLDDPNVHLVCAEGRSALLRDKETYDIIQMTVSDTWTALTSGAYMLAESYLYTTEAMQNIYAHLAQDGLLHMIRHGGLTENLRMLANINTAMEAEGVSDFDKSIICIRNKYMMSILFKKGRFSEDELSRMARFARENGLEIVSMPNRGFGNMLETFIRTTDKSGFIERYWNNISPTTDDKPYFFFFMKWSNLLHFGQSSMEPVVEFPPVATVSSMFIVYQLVLSTALSLFLILLPLIVFSRKRVKRTWAGRSLVYFAGLGLGFIAIEVIIIQKLTLFLGHPLYSTTVTLFSVLVFTGFGSLFSARWFQAPDRKIWLVPLGLAVLLISFIFISPQLVASCIHVPLPLRIAITMSILAPIGLLLGVPFAYGIRILNIQNPTLIPWAWAVNGCSTVIGAILTVILSMNFGFNAVLCIAVLIYLIAFTVMGVSGRVNCEE